MPAQPTDFDFFGLDDSFKRILEMIRGGQKIDLKQAGLKEGARGTGLEALQGLTNMTNTPFMEDVRKTTEYRFSRGKGTQTSLPGNPQGPQSVQAEGSFLSTPTPQPPRITPDMILNQRKFEKNMRGARSADKAMFGQARRMGPVNPLGKPQGINPNGMFSKGGMPRVEQRKRGPSKFYREGGMPRAEQKPGVDLRRKLFGTRFNK
ncbi:MAG: hypothetical protein ACXAEN_25415 [Candidatus Thorarchaeota archaeon]